MRAFVYKCGLEGMVCRTSTSAVTLLALLAGGFGPVASVASAGDKIQFSVASPLFDVPKPERAVRQDPAAALKESLSRHQAQGSDFSYVPSATIIIPSQKSREHFGWTPPFQEEQEKDDRPGLDLFSPRTELSRTNTSGISNDKESDDSKDPYLTKDGRWQQSDRSVSRFGSDPTQKDGDRSDDRLDSRFEERTASDWFRSLDSRAPKNQERMRDVALERRKEDFNSFSGKQDFNSFSEQPYGGSGFMQQDPRGPSDPFHSSAYAPANPGSDWVADSMQGPNEAQVMAQPSMARAWDDLPSAAHPQLPASREQSFSAPSRAPSAPVRLDFPRRPGDLFQ